MSITIFLDECGYTGEDLFSSEQPIFTLATLYAEEALCKEIKNHFFSGLDVTELKHVKLIRNRRPRNMQMVLFFLKYIAEHRELVKFSLIHKKYALLCKFVDIVIEEACYIEGIDLFNKGRNIAIANILYMCLPVMEGEDFFDKFLRSFQNAVRTGEIDAIKSFYKLISEHQCTYGKELLNLIKNSLARIDAKSVFPKGSIGKLDIAFSSALRLMAGWRNENKGEDTFTLIHDNSSSMSKVKYIWEEIVNPNIGETLVGYDRRCMQFPIAISETKFESSENWAGLQLCDILAGALCYYAKWVIRGKDTSDYYGCQIDSYFEGLVSSIYPLWPSDDITPDQLETDGENRGSLVDYLAQIITKVEK